MQINIAVQDMVKSVYPEVVEMRHAEKVKAAATKDFQEVVLSDSVPPAVMQVEFSRHMLLSNCISLVVCLVFSSCQTPR